MESLPKDQKIIFAPDKNLGAYLVKKTGRDMVLWNGACQVHELFSLEKITHLKIQHPDAKLIAHPECEEAILNIADFVGSTSRLLRFVQEDPAQSFIVATEAGILHQMKKRCAGKDTDPRPPG